MQDDPLKRSGALAALAQSKPILMARYGVTELALSGSTVRDAAGVGSDIDIAVSIDGPATSRRCFGVQIFLEDLLGPAVDLVTDRELRPELRPLSSRRQLLMSEITTSHAAQAGPRCDRSPDG